MTISSSGMIRFFSKSRIRRVRHSGIYMYIFRANVENFGEKCSDKDIEWIMKIQKKVALNQLLLHLRLVKGFFLIFFKISNFVEVVIRL